MQTNLLPPLLVVSGLFSLTVQEQTEFCWTESDSEWYSCIGLYPDQTDVNALSLYNFNLFCPDLGKFPNLKKLRLWSESLTIMGNLSCIADRLVYLDVSNNANLKDFPDGYFHGFKKLRYLIIKGCKSITQLPALSDSAETMTHLRIENTAISQLDTGTLCQLNGLRYLQFGPITMENLDALKCLTSLKEFATYGASIEHIPSDFLSHFPNLTYTAYWYGTTIKCMEQPMALQPTTIDLSSSINIYCDCCWSWARKDWIDLANITMNYLDKTHTFCAELGPEHLTEVEWIDLTANDMCEDITTTDILSTTDITTTTYMATTTDTTTTTDTPTTSDIPSTTENQFTRMTLVAKTANLTTNQTKDVLTEEQIIITMESSGNGEQLHPTPGQTPARTSHYNMSTDFNSSTSLSSMTTDVSYEAGTIKETKTARISITTQKTPRIVSSDAMITPQTPLTDYLAWETWTPWSQCSSSCSGGTRFRVKISHLHQRDTPRGLLINQQDKTRLKIKPGSLKKERKIGYDTETEVCNIELCPVWTDWSMWSRCSRTCGLGKRFSSRKCIQGNCKGETSRTSRCKMPECASQDTDILEPEDGNDGPFHLIDMKESDHRTSAKAVGVISALPIVILGLCLIILDIPKMWNDLKFRNSK